MVEVTTAEELDGQLRPSRQLRPRPRLRGRRARWAAGRLRPELLGRPERRDAGVRQPVPPRADRPRVAASARRCSPGSGAGSPSWPRPWPTTGQSSPPRTSTARTSADRRCVESRGFRRVRRSAELVRAGPRRDPGPAAARRIRGPLDRPDRHGAHPAGLGGRRRRLQRALGRERRRVDRGFRMRASSSRRRRCPSCGRWPSTGTRSPVTS